MRGLTAGGGLADGPADSGVGGGGRREWEGALDGGGGTGVSHGWASSKKIFVGPCCGSKKIKHDGIVIFEIKNGGKQIETNFKIFFEM